MGNPRNLENLLRVYRWKAGLKQYELAGLLGCSAAYLSMVENFKAKPRDEFKEKVAEVLKVPKEVLFPDSFQAAEDLLSVPTIRRGNPM